MFIYLYVFFSFRFAFLGQYESSQKFFEHTIPHHTIMNDGSGAVVVFVLFLPRLSNFYFPHLFVLH